MDLLELNSKAQAMFQALIDGVTPDQYGNATPDEGWDVHMLINHVVGGNHVFVARLKELPPPDRDADYLGTDASAALRESAQLLNATFREPGILEKIFQSLVGERSGLTFLKMRFNENLIHGWDIAKATGQETNREPALYEVALAQAPEVFPAARTPGGAYAPVVAAPEGASPADRLAAYLGRNPAWPEK